MSDPRPRRGRPGLPAAATTGALVVALAVGGYLGVRAVMNATASPVCEFRVGERTETFSPEQSAHAATIAGIAVDRGLPPRAATIALATAIQESKLRNLSYGDRDSLGLFQQRPSQGWGSREQVQDPVYAANAFYDVLVQVDGWQDGVITQVAQQVQRSGYPDAYADHEWEGRVLASVLTGHVPGGMGCRLEAVEEASRPPEVADKLQRQLGVAARTSSAVDGTGAAGAQTGDGSDAASVTVELATAEQAWTVGTWAVAHAQAEGITAVTVGERSWTRGDSEEALHWQPAPEPAGGTTTVRIELP